VPRAHYVPVFTEKGDVSLNAGIFHQQAGYAITNNLGLFVTNHFQSQTELFHDESDCSSRIERNIEGYNQLGGIVPFYKLGDDAYFEMPVGLGWGRINGTGSIDCGADYYSSFKTAISIFSIQPTISIKESDYFDFSFFGRYSFYRSKIVKSKVSTGVYNSPRGFDVFMMYQDVFYDSYIDAGAQFSVGFKSLKWYMQISYLLYEYSDHSLNQTMGLRTGLYLNFNTKKLFKSLKEY
jgi:hypothetical protein